MISSCLLLQLSLTIATVVGAPLGSCNPARSISFGDLGCFEPRSGSSTFPESPEKTNTRFFLYTRVNQKSTGEAITASHLSSLFDANKGIKVIIHGFTDTATNPWVLNMKDELLKAGDFNVIAVDWTTASILGLPNYDGAAANTVIVAAVTVQLLHAMIARGAKPQNIHLIGHSLGSHISGYIGRDIPNIARISGLDPAGLFFYTTDTRDRLDPTDATFVDVIHTDAALQVLDGFGHVDPLGHVDFYPNGGSAQPYCGRNTGDVFKQAAFAFSTTRNMTQTLNSVACNHMAAIYYFTSSINAHPTAYGYPCAAYTGFDNGQCTVCNANIAMCQKLGYHASAKQVLGKLYSSTLNGVNTPNFGRTVIVKLTSDSMNEQQTRAYVKVNFNEHEDRSLIEDDVLINRNSVISKAIDIGTNPQSLKEINVSFAKSYNFNLGFGFADKWRFSSITVFDIQSSTSHKFCPIAPAPSSIISGSRATFRLC